MSGTLLAPRSLVKVNGRVARGWFHWSWDGNSLFQADTFSVDFALSDLEPGYGAAWWGKQTDLEIELLAGFPQDPSAFTANDLQSIFIGTVDELEIDWSADTMTLTGRDLTAPFLDNKTSEKFPNLTASQIVEKFAKSHGLTPVVTATKTKVGKYYDADNIRLENDRPEWDLITWLAREEQFVAYVQGRSLHFEPPPKEKATPYQVVWTPASDGPPAADFTRVSTSRTLTVARDIAVTVRSWNSKQKRAFSKKAVRTRPNAKNPQQYVYTIAGLTPEQAQQRANQLLAELSKHEMKLHLAGPADNSLTKASVIALRGTGTEFDQTYFPDVISRTFEADGNGYAWEVSAKNHSPESQANL